MRELSASQAQSQFTKLLDKEIVANDKNFYKKDIEVLNSADFIDKYLKDIDGF